MSLYLLGAKNEHGFYFLKLFGHLRDIPAKIWPKVWFPWVSKDIPNLLAPALSSGRPTPHRKISGPKSRVCVPFLCLCVCVSLGHLEESLGHFPGSSLTVDSKGPTGVSQLHPPPSPQQDKRPLRNAAE